MSAGPFLGDWCRWVAYMPWKGTTGHGKDRVARWLVG